MLRGDQRESKRVIYRLEFLPDMGVRMKDKQLGQSLVEIALALPILLLVLAGTLEVGWYFNVRLNFLDASREGGRIASDGSLELYNAHHNRHSPDNDGSNIDCGSHNLDTYEIAACMTLGNMQNTFNRNNDSGWDDIVVSVYQTKNGKVTQVLPADSYGSWSLTGAQRGEITPEYIERYALRSADPNQCLAMGWIVIEVFYTHKQFLGLLVIGDYVPLYSAGYVYSIFPKNTLGGQC
jgi:hypothetical protein